VPGLAPLLGLVGLAPAFVAVAGLARTMPRRAGLGAAGALWLSAAEAVAGDRFLYAAPAAVPDPSLWTGSIAAAATEALPPFVTTMALAPALVWAAFACLFPMAVRGRSLRADAALGLLWAGGLAAALILLGGPISASDTPAEARGALGGPLVAVVAALAVTALRRRRREALGEPVGNPPRRPGGGA
jgi:hypothetical protein